MKYVQFSKKETQSRRSFSIPWFLGITILILLVVQVIISNRLATEGVAITSIEQNIETVSEENLRLQSQIASTSALLAIKNKAQKLGFTKTVVPIFLNDALPVALGTH